MLIYVGQVKSSQIGKQVDKFTEIRKLYELVHKL